MTTETVKIWLKNERQAVNVPVVWMGDRVCVHRAIGNVDKYGDITFSSLGYVVSHQKTGINATSDIYNLERAIEVAQKLDQLRILKILDRASFWDGWSIQLFEEYAPKGLLQRLVGAIKEAIA